MRIQNDSMHFAAIRRYDAEGYHGHIGQFFKSFFNKACIDVKREHGHISALNCGIVASRAMIVHIKIVE